MNKGIGMAKGKFLGMLCLNDYYEPGVLNEVIRTIVGLPQPAFLVGNCNMLDKDDNLLFVNKPKGLTTIGILTGKSYPHNPAAYFYDKRLHDNKMAGLMSVDDKYAFDLDFLLRAFSFAKVHYVDKIFGNFRMLPSSLTVLAKNSGQLHQNTKNAMDRYVRSLPRGQQMVIRIFLKIHCLGSRFEYYWSRIRYYCHCPQEIKSFLVRKI